MKQKRKVTTFYMDVDLEMPVRRYALEHHTSMAAIINKLLRDFIEHADEEPEAEPLLSKPAIIKEVKDPQEIANLWQLVREMPTSGSVKVCHSKSAACEDTGEEPIKKNNLQCANDSIVGNIKVEPPERLNKGES